ncbi:MAG: RNA methyltransferase [Ilumatobacteraceae bacterium]|nr:RNA methyltransferase [Ilumatobacteraceae bacterium]MDP5069220.1 RNA methyltransferase [Ilumatobacteraceae bacterium]
MLVDQFVRDDYDGYEAAGVYTHVLDERTFNSVSDTESPRGIMAVCEMPAGRPLSFSSSDWLLVLVEVADPGNLGTLVRSAEAAGASGVVLVGSTVDPWSPKVLRASAGAMLHVPIWQIDSLDQLQMAGVRLFGTTSHNNDAGLNPESIYSADLSGLIGVVLGNEARGLDPESHVDLWVTVPQVGRSESLNVAMAGTVIAMHIAHARG